MITFEIVRFNLFPVPEILPITCHIFSVDVIGTSTGDISCCCQSFTNFTSTWLQRGNTLIFGTTQSLEYMYFNVPNWFDFLTMLWFISDCTLEGVNTLIYSNVLQEVGEYHAVKMYIFYATADCSPQCSSKMNELTRGTKLLQCTQYVFRISIKKLVFGLRIPFSECFTQTVHRSTPWFMLLHCLSAPAAWSIMRVFVGNNSGLDLTPQKPRGLLIVVRPQILFQLQYTFYFACSFVRV